MSSNTTQSDNAQHRQQRRLECNCIDEGQATVSLPGVGRVCRTCHTPISAPRWPDTLRTMNHRHRTGETTTYHTWFVGLDAVGRAVYHDEWNTRLLRVVPKHHPEFRADTRDLTDRQRRPLRQYPPKHAPGTPALLDVPFNDVLIAVDRTPTEDGHYSKKQLAANIAETALEEEWTFLSESLLDAIQRNVERTHRRTNDDFPIWAGAFVLDQYRD